jgi:hypothetical protein
MHIIGIEDNKQVVTNLGFVGTADIERRKNCGRYCSIDDDIRDFEGAMDWRYGMDVLYGARQKDVSYHLDGERRKVSTRWSALFDLAGREVYICRMLDYGTVYRFRLKSRGEYMEKD